ncbi:MAG: DNA-directed RNA polymerase subunit omega [Tissierellia bacterium]|nr:DNA-directed RNA polymerase subunit omega [Tissierellia bacterium]
MRIPSFEEIKKVTDSRYELVMLVSKRARKLVDGEPPLIDAENEKPVTTAIKEVLRGKIVFGEHMTDRQYALKIEKERLEMVEELKAKMIQEKIDGDEEEE